MYPSAIGDLAHGFLTRNALARLDRDVSRLGTELTMGITADVTASRRGDVGPVAALERRMTSLAAFGTTASEAATREATRQSAIDRIAEEAALVQSQALAQMAGADPAAGKAAARAGTGAFASAIAALNTQVAGRSVFAGIATDTAAVLPAGDVLDGIAVLLPPGATASDLADAAADYFAPGGGFELVAWQGDATPGPDVRVSPDDGVPGGPTALDPRLRDTLAGLAMAALVDRGVLGGDVAAERLAIQRAGHTLLSSAQQLVDLGSEIGGAEARIEAAAIRNEAEIAALEQARVALIGVDPFDTAARLEETQTQLETLYAVTARLSRLTLADFLR